jgi:hypothetical protein
MSWANPGHQAAGPRARRQAADRRFEQLHRLILAEGWPVHRRGLWPAILWRFGQVHPELTLTAKLPRGSTLDSVCPTWLHAHQLTTSGRGPRTLREGYLSWLDRSGTASPIPARKFG